MSSTLASSTFSTGKTGPFSLVIPATTYCAGSDVEGEVLLQFPQVQDGQIDEVTVELRGTMEVYVIFVSRLSRSDRHVSRRHQLRVAYCPAHPFYQDAATRIYQEIPLDARVCIPPTGFPCPSVTVQLPSALWADYSSVRVLGRVPGSCHDHLQC